MIDFYVFIYVNFNKDDISENLFNIQIVYEKMSFCEIVNIISIKFGIWNLIEILLNMK